MVSRIRSEIGSGEGLRERWRGERIEDLVLAELQHLKRWK